MYCDATRHLKLLRSMNLTSPTSRKIIRVISSEDSRPPLTPKKQVVQIMHGALKKKDFFLGELCPLYFCEIHEVLKKKAYSP